MRAVPSNVAAVSAVQEIKSAIEQRPLEERALLVAELCGWTDDEWDRQMKADAKSGKFALLNEVAASVQDPLLGFRRMSGFRHA